MFVCILSLNAFFACAPENSGGNKTAANATQSGSLPTGSQSGSLGQSLEKLGLDLVGSVSYTSTESSLPLYIGSGNTLANATGSMLTTNTLSSSFTNPVIVASPLSSLGWAPAALMLYNVKKGSFDFSLSPFPKMNNAPHGRSETFYYFALNAGSYQMTDRNSCKVRMYAGKVASTGSAGTLSLATSNIENALGSITGDITQVYYSVESQSTSQSNPVVASLVVPNPNLQPLPSTSVFYLDNFQSTTALSAVKVHYLFVRANCSTFYIPVSTSQEIAVTLAGTSNVSTSAVVIPNSVSAGFLANMVTYNTPNSVLRYQNSSGNFSLYSQTTAIRNLKADSVNTLLFSSSSAIATANSAKTITAFALNGVPGTITGQNIAVTLPYETDFSALHVTFTTTGASVNIAGSTQLSGNTYDFTNSETVPVVYTVVAADGSKINYNVTTTPQTINASFCIQSGGISITIALHIDGSATSTNRVYAQGTPPCGEDPSNFLFSKGSYTLSGTNSVDVMFLGYMHGVGTINPNATAPTSITLYDTDRKFTLTYNKF